jgi:hypothetical protein
VERKYFSYPASVSSIPSTRKLVDVPGSGEFNISGFRTKDVRRRVKGVRVSGPMKRLRTHESHLKDREDDKYYLAGTYKYCLNGPEK